MRHARQHPHRVAQQPRLAVDSRDGEHDPGKQHQAQPAAALREEAEQGEQKQGRREKPAHVVPDAGESELRIAEGEDRPVDIREHELGQRLGRKVPTSCPSSGMFAERRLDDVVERGNEERRAQQRPGDRTARDLAGKRPHALAAEAAATPREPADAQESADVGDLRKARVERPRAGHRDQPPAAAPAGEARCVGELDAEQQRRQQRNRVDRGVRQPGEGAVEGEGDRSRSAHPPAEREPSQQQIRREPRDQLEQHVLVELAVGKECQQRRREQGRRLHLPRERRTGPLVRVPPGQPQVNEVERSAVTERLRREAVVGIDRPFAGQPSGRHAAHELAARPERVRIRGPEQRRCVGDDHRGCHRQHRPPIRRESAPRRDRSGLCTPRRSSRCCSPSGEPDRTHVLRSRRRLNALRAAEPVNFAAIAP